MKEIEIIKNIDNIIFIYKEIDNIISIYIIYIDINYYITLVKFYKNIN